MTRQTTRMFTAAMVFAATTMLSLVVPLELSSEDRAEARGAETTGIDGVQQIAVDAAKPGTARK